MEKKNRRTRLTHLSVGVRDPQKCASALADLTEGEIQPFHPVEGAYVCLWGGWSGQFVEFYPLHAKIVPGENGAEFKKLTGTPGYQPIHLNLDVGLEPERIQSVAEQYGFRYCFRPRNGGPLHEVWLENELLVELVTE